MKNLAEVSKSEQLSFLNSFDHVLSDLDGVIWLHYKPLPGVSSCINHLKKNGKKLHYVSNNSSVPVEFIKDKLNSAGIEAENEDIITPVIAIVSHLRQIKFDKQLYVIALNTMKNALRQEGFTVAEGPHIIEESMQEVISHVNDDKSIGAVVIDVDININFIKLQKAATYLTRKDCLFIAGAGDARLPVGLGLPLIGPHYFLKPLKDFSGREPYQLAKPSVHYNEFIKERFKISDPSRVLFIGDSINEDLNFATKCGYQKLLVLSGITKSEHLSDWQHPEEYKPDYYLENLGALNDIIHNCFEISQK